MPSREKAPGAEQAEVDVAARPKLGWHLPRRSRLVRRRSPPVDERHVRQVRLAVALVGVPLVALVVAWVLIPHPYYTGTDSIRTRSFVQPVATGQTLCVRGLQLPAGTAQVQLQMLTGGPVQPQMVLTVRTPDSVFRSRLPAVRTGSSGPTSPVFRIPVRPGAPASVPASACLRPQTGLVNLGGTANIGGVPPTLNGVPSPARVAVWFLPSAGAKRSLVSQAPQVLRRVSLFRPDGVGPWFYVLLLAVALPVTLGGSVRLLARAPITSWRRLAIGVAVVGFITSASWALLSPAFQAPDEPDHFAYVQSLVERGQPPTQQAGVPPWSTAETRALDATRAAAIAEENSSRPPWLAADERAWRQSVADAPPNRADGGGPTTAATHGPLYYAALAPAYLVTRQRPIWTQITAMRLTSALFAALTVLFVFLAARELLPHRRFFATAAALLVAFEPMFSFISGSINNDVGVNAAATCLVFLLLRAFRRGLSPLLALALGLVIGVLPLIKGTGYELWPVALLALLALLARRRNRGALGGIAVVLALAVAVQITWSHVAPLLHRSTVTAPGGAAGVSSSPLLHGPGLFLSYLWQVFLPRLPFMADHFSQPWPAFTIYVERGWAAFGWYAVLFPLWVYVIIAALMLAFVPLGTVAAFRERAWIREHWAQVGLLVLTPIAVVAAVENAFATAGERPFGIVAEMGRYAFPAIAPLALLAIGALVAFGRRRLVGAATALVVLAMGLSCASWLLTLQGFYT